MSPLIYQIAGGTYVVPAAVVLAAMISASAVVRRRWVVLPGLAAAVLAVSAVVVSAPALSWWLAVAWGATTLTWLCTGWSARRPRPWWRSAARLAALACTVAAGGVEVGYERVPILSPGHAAVLYVIGDSVTAGLGRAGETTWPSVLRTAHNIRIADCSRPGCTVRQAVGNAAPAARDDDGVVLIEVGGNDVIGRTDPRQFGADLETLARTVRASNRPTVMLEVPRFPFDDRYGVEQRRVAARFHIRLVPRRAFAGILAGPGNTIDGVHLSNAGQRTMADLVWRVVGPALSS